MNVETGNQKCDVTGGVRVMDDASIKEAVAAKINCIVSHTQAEEWLLLREGIGDPQLLAIDEKNYIHHIQLIVVQLLMGSVAKALGGPAMFCSDPINGFARMASIIEPALSRFNNSENIYRQYNSAFGSSAFDSVAAMLRVFEKMVCDKPLKFTTFDVMERYLQAVWVSLNEALEKGSNHKIS